MTLHLSRLTAATLMFALCLLAPSGQAQMEELSTRVKLPNPATSNRKAKTKTQGKLKFEASRYQSSIPQKSHLDQSLLAAVQVQAQVQTDKTETALDLTAESYLDWGNSQFSVQELYWNYSHGNQVSQTTIGRKLEFWSQLDRDWQLGLWQPESLFDSLRPVDQGLTGVFYKVRSENFESLAFVSPLFIPTMGPEVKEENGSLVSDSRWHQTPSSTFVLFGKERKVVYSLNIPDAWELAQKPGAGYRLRWGGDRPGPWVSAHLGYKPMNKLLLKYDKKLGSSEEGEDTGSAPLYPTVGYHALGGVDVGHRFVESMVSVSYLEDQPQAVKQEAGDPFIIQRPTVMKAYSAHADTRIQFWGFEQPIGVGLDYLRINGGTYQDFDSDGRSHGAVFSDRFYFTHAAAIRFDFVTVLFKKPLISRFKYLREFDQRGMVGTAEFHLSLVPKLALTLGADVLGVDDTSLSNSDDRFLNQFRANDRVYGGVGYVF